jgi:hypothetical protein
MSYSRLNDPAVDDPIPLASVNTTAGRTKHQRDQSLGHTYNNNPFDDVNSVGNAPGPMSQKSHLKPTNMNAFSRFAEKRGAGRKIRPTDKKRKIQLLKSYAPDWYVLCECYACRKGLCDTIPQDPHYHISVGTYHSSRRSTSLSLPELHSLPLTSSMATVECFPLTIPPFAILTLSMNGYRCVRRLTLPSSLTDCLTEQIAHGYRRP